MLRMRYRAGAADVWLLCNRRVNSEETPRPDGKQLSPDVPHLVDLLLDVYTVSRPTHLSPMRNRAIDTLSYVRLGGSQNSTFRREAAVAGPRWARSYFTWAHVVDNLLRWVQQHHAGQGMDGAAGLAGLRSRQLHECVWLLPLVTIHSLTPCCIWLAGTSR